MFMSRLTHSTRTRRQSRMFLGGLPFLSLLVLSPVQAGEDDEALFVAPRKIIPGAETSVLLHSFLGATSQPRRAGFEIHLAETDGSQKELLAAGETDESGWASVILDIPNVPMSGNRRIEALVEGVEIPLVIPVTVYQTQALLLETDKPIYKPGQTIHGRAITLNNALRPLKGKTVELEIRDAKGNKVHRQEITTNNFGVAVFDFSLADEINCGEWKFQAESGDATSEVAVRVEPYVLPRFRLEVEFDKEWFLLDEVVTGTVRSSYFFGKPVAGEITAVAHRLQDGEWEPYASHTAPMVDGAGRFQIDPVMSLPDGGKGGISIDFAVTDTADHKEKTKQFVRITEAPFELKIGLKSPSAKPGFGLEFRVETMDPGGKPVTLPVAVTMYANDDDGNPVLRLQRTIMTQGGATEVAFPVPYQAEYLVLEGEVSQGIYRSRVRMYGPVAYSPTATYIKLERKGEGPVSIGDPVEFNLLSSQPGDTFYEVLAGGRAVCSGVVGESIRFPAMPSMAPEAKLLVYRIFPDNEVGVDSQNFQVRPSENVNLEVDFDKKEAEPGESVKIQISAGVQSMVGLAVVDESVFALSQGRLDLSKVYRELVSRFGAPSVADLQSDFADRPHTIGAHDVLSEAGLQVAVSTSNGSNPALDIPRGYTFWPGDYGTTGSYSLPRLDEGGGGLAEVERVRQFFPETWVWEPTLLTDTAGRATLELTAPDSITNWKMRAVSTSADGVGLASGDMVVFQEFFVEPDLPYAVTRGEEMWLPVAVYNYLESPQPVLLELEPSEGFEILGEPAVSVEVGPNAVEGASFPIRATGLGSFPFKLTARGPLKADAVIRTLRVEPEGSPQEAVLNEALTAGQSLRLDASFPAETISGSERLILTITGSQVAQTINGVEDLVGKPYG